MKKLIWIWQFYYFHLLKKSISTSFDKLNMLIKWSTWIRWRNLFSFGQKLKGRTNFWQRMKLCYFKRRKREYNIEGKIFQICKEKYFSLGNFPHALIFVWRSLPVAFQAICLSSTAVKYMYRGDKLSFDPSLIWLASWPSQVSLCANPTTGSHTVLSKVFPNSILQNNIFVNPMG